MRRLDIALALAGLLMGLVATTLLLTPRLTGRFPEGVAYSAVQPVTLTFNRQITVDSAARHFSLMPPVSGQFEVQGRHLLFTPSSPLRYGQTYTVNLAAGLRAANKLPLLRTASWQFQVSGPNLLYLRLEADGRAALWLHVLNGTSEASKLTPSGVDVWDYLVSGDGRLALITNVAGEQGDELLLLNLNSGEQERLLFCPDSRCRQGRLQPGGQLVAYERSDLAGSPSTRQVWLLDRSGGRTWPAHPPDLLEGAAVRTQFSHSPRWSADGRYLAYFKPDAYALIVLDTAGGVPVLFPANVNEMGEWSRVGYRLTYTDFVQWEPQSAVGDPEGGPQWAAAVPDSEAAADPGSGAAADPGGDDHAFFIQLMLLDLNADERFHLGGEQVVFDGPAAWHPDGRVAAFTRSTGVGGRQIWLLEIEAGTAQLATRPLTTEIAFNHTALSWSPDGRYLAFMRSTIDYGTSAPTLWLYDSDWDSMALLATEAFLPQWLP
jgi:Tol biopolymer transport system component